MPELPEVETFVRDVRPKVLGRTIERASLSHTNVLRGVSSRRLRGRLKGATIQDVFRRAKHAVLALGDDRLVVQPGMTGSLVVYQGQLTREERRYAVLRAYLNDGQVMAYRDVRRIGTVRLLDAKGFARYSERLGPEPLEPAFDVAALAAALSATQRSVKKVLMDQRRIAGLGNIYANEVLFAARIDPSKPAAALSHSDHVHIHGAIRRILEAAVTSRGSTVRDYRTGTGQPGAFQLELLVYGKAGEPCAACGTRLTGTHEIDGRITVFCHRCQS